MSKANLFKILKACFALLISFLILYYLINSIYSKAVIINVDTIIHDLMSNSLLLLLLTLLSPINWLIESYKWNQLVKRVKYFTEWTAFKIILSSLSVSLLTPNRIGDFLGRIHLFKKEDKYFATYATFLNSIAQFNITIVVGLFCMAEYYNIFLNKYEIPEVPRIMFYILGLLFLILFFNSSLLKKVFQKLQKAGIETNNYSYINSRRSKISLLTLSLIRYLIFTSQFVLASVCLGATFNEELISAIILVFFLNTIVPTSWISDVPVRLGVSYFVFEIIGNDPMIGLASSFLLWVVNIFIPSIAGLIFLNKMNWKKSKVQ